MPWSIFNRIRRFQGTTGSVPMDDQTRHPVRVVHNYASSQPSYERVESGRTKFVPNVTSDPAAGAKVDPPGCRVPLTRARGLLCVEPRSTPTQK